MDQDEFLAEINTRFVCNEYAAFQIGDFEDVRRASPTPLDASKIAEVCKHFREWHWRMFAYRLFFKVRVEQYLRVVVDLLQAEPNKNCRAYLLQILEVRANKSHAAKIFNAIRGSLAAIEPSVQRSLLIAKLLKNLEDEELLAIALADIASGKCRIAALRAYERANRDEVRIALASIPVAPTRRP